MTQIPPHSSFDSAQDDSPYSIVYFHYYKKFATLSPHKAGKPDFLNGN